MIKGELYLRNGKIVDIYIDIDSCQISQNISFDIPIYIVNNIHPGEQLTASYILTEENHILKVEYVYYGFNNKPNSPCLLMVRTCSRDETLSVHKEIFNKNIEDFDIERPEMEIIRNIMSTDIKSLFKEE